MKIYMLLLKTSFLGAGLDFFKFFVPKGNKCTDIAVSRLFTIGNIKTLGLSTFYIMLRGGNQGASPYYANVVSMRK